MSGNPFDPFSAPAPPPAPPTQGGYAAPSAAYQQPMYGAQQGQQYPPQQQQQQQQQQGYGGMQPQQQQQYQQPPQQQFPGMAQQQPQKPPPTPTPAPAPVQDPWSMAPQSQPQQQQGNPYGGQQPHMQAYQQQPVSAPATGGYDPFAAAPSQLNQLVVSQQPTNPYGGIVNPAQAPTAPQNQSMVPATQQASPWGMPQAHAPQGYGAPAPTGGSFDPFAAPAPPPAPVPMPAPAPTPAPAQENPFGDFLPAEPPAPAPAPKPAEEIVVSSQERQLQQYQGGAPPPEDPNARALVASPVRNPYAGEIARRAPPGASPLPKAELVKKTGYALSRISFRTIVMKKWKQSFWVQYGSHTMLWFRSEEDFKDWLNNPYHTQAQRNFLIKLAVNFVHDLYKPNVRGYQVTQCRVKPYGTKMVRQFKLERWMDYGPTIAAAFGSYDHKEVEELRKAIVECMRNTPLDNGIRATGAVKQQQQEQDNDTRPQSQSNGHGQAHHGDMAQRFNSGASAYTQPNPTNHHQPMVSRSVVSATDLLDDHKNFDDSASVPPTPSRSLVPAHNPHQAYPGAPSFAQQQPYAQPAPMPAYQQPPQQQYQQAPPTPQQQYQQYQQVPSQQQFQQPPQQQHQAYQQPPPPQSYPAQYSQHQQQQYGYQQPAPSAGSYPVQGAQY